MPNCIVAGCTSKQNKHSAMKGVILHVFPPNLDRIKTWLLQTGQDFGNLDEFAQKVLEGKRTDAYRLCSVHFTPQCYLERASKKALRVDAVPTIFNNRDALSLNGAKFRRLMTSGNRTDFPCKTIEASTQTHPGLYMKTTKWKGLSHVITDPHRLDEIRKKFAEKILGLTLEIINLLTGEDYSVVKKTSGEYVTQPQMSGGLKTQSSIMETPPLSLTPERNYKKILEVTDNITELLTGEVPVTFQDVTVYFSMEKLEYLEEHKDLYKDVMMENPHYQGGNVVLLKFEVKDEHGNPYVKGDMIRMEEEVPPEISTDPGGTQRDIKVKDEGEGHVRIKEEEYPTEVNTDPNDSRGSKIHVKSKEEEERYLRIKEEEFPVEIISDPGDTRRDVKAEVEEEGHARNKEEEKPPEIITDPGDTRRDVKAEVKKEGHAKIKEEEKPPEISTGIKYNVETDPIGLHNGETDDDITDDSSDESPVAPNSNGAHHPTHPSPDPPAHGTSFSDHSYPIPRHVEGEEVPSPEIGRPLHTRPLCEKSFSAKFLLQQHEKTHKGKLPYFCLECGKDYLHKSRFISHRRVHTGEKPYSCTKCGKSFANKPDLVRHHRTHTGEKPFSCVDCGKRFTQKVHLVTHQKKHALQKP